MTNMTIVQNILLCEVSLILHLITGPGVRFGSPRPETRGGRGGGGHIPYRNCMLTMVLRDSLGE